MESQPEDNAALAAGQSWPDVAQIFSTRPLSRGRRFDFEQQSAKHWLAILGDREHLPGIVTHPPKDGTDRSEQDHQSDPLVNYVTIK